MPAMPRSRTIQDGQPLISKQKTERGDSIRMIVTETKSRSLDHIASCGFCRAGMGAFQAREWSRE
jgi:hypothetical protein